MNLLLVELDLAHIHLVQGMVGRHSLRTSSSSKCRPSSNSNSNSNSQATIPVSPASLLPRRTLLRGASRVKGPPPSMGCPLQGPTQASRRGRLAVAVQAAMALMEPDHSCSSSSSSSSSSSRSSNSARVAMVPSSSSGGMMAVSCVVKAQAARG